MHKPRMYNTEIGPNTFSVTVSPPTQSFDNAAKDQKQSRNSKYVATKRKQVAKRQKSQSSTKVLSENVCSAQKLEANTRDTQLTQ